MFLVPRWIVRAGERPAEGSCPVSPEGGTAPAPYCLRFATRTDRDRPFDRSRRWRGRTRRGGLPARGRPLDEVAQSLAAPRSGPGLQPEVGFHPDPFCRQLFERRPEQFGHLGGGR